MKESECYSNLMLIPTLYETADHSLLGVVGKDLELILYVCSCFSPNQRLLAVSLLDCTVKILFADTLKVSIAY